MKKISKSLASILFSSGILTGFNVANAQESLSRTQNSGGVEWNGYIDFYYQSSPQGHKFSPATPAGPSTVEGRFFDRHINQMTLNMAELSVKKKVGKVSFYADFAFGEMVDQLSGGGSQSVTGAGIGQNPTNAAANEPTRNLTQATVTYAASDALSVTAGKFFTHIGLEGIKAKDNFQYSRSYTFNYGLPLWHEGVSATYFVSPDRFATSIYIVNAWDGRVAQEQNNSNSVGVNLKLTGPTGIVANYNYIGGAEGTDQRRREVHEVNLTYTLSPMITVAADYINGSQKNIPALGDAKWNGITIYVKAALNKVYSISPRYEVFDDSDNGYAIAGGLAALGTKQKITSWTVANTFKLDDGLEVRLELRSDKSDSNLFFKDKDGLATNQQDSYVAAVLYAF